MNFPVFRWLAWVLVGCTADPIETADTEAAETYVIPPDSEVPPDTDLPDTDDSVLPDTDADPMAYSAPEVIFATTGNAKTASIAVTDDGRVHVVWHDFSLDPANLYHAIRENGEWTTETLPLLAYKSIRPFLLVDENAVDLVFDAQPDAETTEVWSARWEDGAWSTPVLVGLGEKAILARDSAGRLHSLYYTEGWPTHSVRVDGVWEDGDPIALQDNDVNTFGMALAAHGDTMVAGVSVSDAEGFDDIHRLEWDGAGWTEDVLFESVDYSSDEPEAFDAGGTLHWTWTEQAQFGPYDIGVVWTIDGESPLFVALDPGFSMDPTLVVPSDGDPVVAWVTPSGGIELDRFPFDEPLEIADQGTGPKLTLDSAGYVHLVYYAYNGDDQDIWYTTNRAN